ncbi:deoxyribonuclease I [Lacticaseibacillus sp. GG6-2]
MSTMPSAKLNLTTLFQLLQANLGASGWWPADSPTEILVGAVLVQNTNWTNVDRSLTNLRNTTGFDPATLAGLDETTWQPLIRPSGFYRNKSKALWHLFHWLQTNQFDLTSLGTQTPAQLRRQLLALPGIGEETADAMRLYVFNQPTFIADHYARRLFGWLKQPFTSYPQLAAHTHTVDSWNLHDAQEFHGLIDNFGKLVKTPETFQTSFLANHELELPQLH